MTRAEFDTARDTNIETSRAAETAAAKVAAVEKRLDEHMKEAGGSGNHRPLAEALANLDDKFRAAYEDLRVAIERRDALTLVLPLPQWQWTADLLETAVGGPERAFDILDYAVRRFPRAKVDELAAEVPE